MNEPGFLPKLTDSEILVRMNAGLIEVWLDDLSVWKFHPAKRKLIRLAERRCEPGRIRFNLRVKGFMQRTIHRSRLVWLWTRRSLVPAGMVIDHRDLDSMNDLPDNLRLQALADSCRQGNGVVVDAKMEEVAAYFDCLAFLGREPGWAT